MKVAISFIAILILQASMAITAQAHSSRSEADQALYERAVKECKSWKHYPNGASIHINYAKGWFRCEDRNDRKRNNKRN